MDIFDRSNTKKQVCERCGVDLSLLKSSERCVWNGKHYCDICTEIVKKKPSTANTAPKPSPMPVSKRKVYSPTFCQGLENYQMNMHTDSGEEYCFTLTGLKLYHPNMAGCCGYGSDDWFFHCKYNEQDCILCFSIGASYGAMWNCAVITNTDAQQLHRLLDTEWDSLTMESKDRIYCLHPDTIDAAKEIVQDTSSRCGIISDKEFYGR